MGAPRPQEFDQLRGIERGAGHKREHDQDLVLRQLAANRDGGYLADRRVRQHLGLDFDRRVFSPRRRIASFRRSTKK